MAQVRPVPSSASESALPYFPRSRLPLHSPRLEHTSLVFVLLRLAWVRVKSMIHSAATIKNKR
jgi:hypothetical protein